jgi:hypothetical protein
MRYINLKVQFRLSIDNLLIKLEVGIYIAIKY